MQNGGAGRGPCERAGEPPPPPAPPPTPLPPSSSPPPPRPPPTTRSRRYRPRRRRPRHRRCRHLSPRRARCSKWNAAARRCWLRCRSAGRVNVRAALPALCLSPRASRVSSAVPRAARGDRARVLLQPARERRHQEQTVRSRKITEGEKTAAEIGRTCSRWLFFIYQIRPLTAAHTHTRVSAESRVARGHLSLSRPPPSHPRLSRPRRRLPQLRPPRRRGSPNSSFWVRRITFGPGGFRCRTTPVFRNCASVGRGDAIGGRRLRVTRRGGRAAVSGGGCARMCARMRAGRREARAVTILLNVVTELVSQASLSRIPWRHRTCSSYSSPYCVPGERLVDLGVERAFIVVTEPASQSSCC